MTLQLASKAKTLEDLKGKLKHADVLPVVRFYASDYSKNKNTLLNDIQTEFKDSIIIRSSSANEDNEKTSNAGGFDSVLDVDTKEISTIDDGINQVITSYGDTLNDKDEVFAQPMLKNVTMSGVIFTADIDTLAAYYIINYDESGSTSSVTSGESNNLKTFICVENHDVEDHRLQQLIKASQECVTLFKNKSLDIEFAFVGNTLYILQVRAIVVKDKDDLSHIDIKTNLKKIHSKIKKLNAPHPNLLGDTTIFGVMPDWNPAEIIGIRPKRLALSLYKELITDATWAYQRDNYGYRNLRSHPLLVSFLGVPFIDVRISFNSFIPKSLDERIAEKLVNHYLNQLTENINHHDKVEFEIIYSCYYFGIDKKLQRLKDFGFSEDELKKIEVSLLELTNTIIDVENGLYNQDLQKVDLLHNKFEAITQSDLSLVDKIYWLIQDTKRYGTLPFAGLARAGFIAVQLLQSFINEGIITPQEYDAYLTSLNTVSKKLTHDISNLDKTDFLDIYGHLRPGTYDILSARYDEAYDTYFGSTQKAKPGTVNDFSFSSKQKREIEALITQNGVRTTFEDLMTFIKKAIEGRESAKFVFTKHLSQTLKYIEEFGERFDFSKEELAHLDIQTLIDMYVTLDHRDVKEILSSDINKNKEYYTHTKAIKLPAAIVNPNDVYSFYLEETDANFVTLKKIEAAIVIEKDIELTNLDNKIICIKSADPGYDYLFSKNIGGLITCYGGANSHMAIRCAEMGIPAVIGCGENSFEKFTKANSIEIDAANKQVKVLS